MKRLMTSVIFPLKFFILDEERDNLLDTSTQPETKGKAMYVALAQALESQVPLESQMTWRQKSLIEIFRFTYVAEIALFGNIIQHLVLSCGYDIFHWNPEGQVDNNLLGYANFIISIVVFSGICFQICK